MTHAMTEKVADITHQGWTEVPFLLPNAQIEELARLGNRVISIAQENEVVHEALTYHLDIPAAILRRTGSFGILGARNSADDKLALHTGYRSYAQADTVLPIRRQPRELRAYWDVSQEALREVERMGRKVVTALGGEYLASNIFAKSAARNVHLRTLRLTGALSKPVGTEVLSGHIDVGLSSMHLYETHGGWFKGAPCPPELAFARNSAKRRQDIAAIRNRLAPMTPHRKNAVFFLGADWATFAGVPLEAQSLPACYHAGFRPTSAAETVAAAADAITEGKPDRVSLVVFMGPNATTIRKGGYDPALPATCRPVY